MPYSSANGFETERNDGLSKAAFNSDVFEMPSLVNDKMTTAIYFDAVERRYKIAGIVDGDVPLEELKRQIEQSYNLVKPKLKRRKTQ